MNCTGAVADMWLLCLVYVCFVLNLLACASLGDIPPLQALTGVMQDISILDKFYFNERVYYALDDNQFPSESTEKAGFFVGFGEGVGNAMTFKILTEDTHQIIY